jgi:hypothetical protein
MNIFSAITICLSAFFSMLGAIHTKDDRISRTILLVLAIAQTIAALYVCGVIR